MHHTTTTTSTSTSTSTSTRTNTMTSLARETAATATAMFDVWRWCSCWCWCSNAAGEAAPEDPPLAEKTRGAMRSLEACEVSWGEARRHLEARRLGVAPCAKSAASALIMIGDVSRSCDGDATGAAKAAERAVRDVVVLRCRLFMADPGNREDFLLAAEEAFGRRGRGLEREVQACLLLAYHKLRRRV